MAVKLWFDVGKDRYTAELTDAERNSKLWFDVGKDRYTASRKYFVTGGGCGLM